MSGRSPLGAARATGSARSGTAHWIAQRLSALALIPLGLAAAVCFFWVLGGGYPRVHAWMHAPWALAFVVVLVAVALWHGFLGLKMIVEDYVPQPRAAFALITLLRFFTVALAILGIVAAAIAGLGSP